MNLHRADMMRILKIYSDGMENAPDFSIVGQKYLLMEIPITTPI